MKSESINRTYDVIIHTAISGFLEYGYHGFTMDLCADRVGIKKSTLYYHIGSKLDLAMQVLAALTERSVTVICEQQPRYSIPDGASLAILPARLWESGEPKLQHLIRSYYEDWRFNFLGEESYLSLLDGSGFCENQFLIWLGHWLMHTVEIDTKPPSEVIVASTH